MFEWVSADSIYFRIMNFDSVVVVWTSVTRCWNKNVPNFFNSCQKVATAVELKSNIFETAQQ